MIHDGVRDNFAGDSGYVFSSAGSSSMGGAGGYARTSAATAIA